MIKQEYGVIRHVHTYGELLKQALTQSIVLARVRHLPSVQCTAATASAHHHELSATHSVAQSTSRVSFPRQDPHLDQTACVCVCMVRA